VRLLTRLDSLPLAIENPDLGWGLLALSLFRRGQAHELRGDTAQALDFFERFVQTRHGGGAPAPFEARARERLDHLSAGRR
jgi:hypothetical protein